MIKNIKNLITSIDVLNTINGGVSEPFLSLRQHSESREIRIRVPGINRETLQVEIVNNRLSIFYLIPIFSEGILIQMPQVVYNQTIPHFVDTTGIKASYEGNELVVNLPFDRHSNGFNRKLEIDKG